MSMRIVCIGVYMRSSMNTSYSALVTQHKKCFTLEAARMKGIVVNAIQSGQHQHTKPAWQAIASLGQGHYFQVEDSGNTVAVSTPYDEELSALAAELEATRLYFGDREMKKAQQSKLEANARLRKELSSEALARRDSFNATASGKATIAAFMRFPGPSDPLLILDSDACMYGGVATASVARTVLASTASCIAKCKMTCARRPKCSRFVSLLVLGKLVALQSKC